MSNKKLNIEDRGKPTTIVRRFMTSENDGAPEPSPKTNSVNIPEPEPVYIPPSEPAAAESGQKPSYQSRVSELASQLLTTPAPAPAPAEPAPVYQTPLPEPAPQVFKAPLPEPAPQVFKAPLPEPAPQLVDRAPPAEKPPSAPKKRGSGLEYYRNILNSSEAEHKYLFKNMLEDIVVTEVTLSARHVKELCKCEKCISDICAIVLSKTPPIYVTTTEGELINKAEVLKLANLTNISVEIFKAIELVKVKPAHPIYESIF